MYPAYPWPPLEGWPCDGSLLVQHQIGELPNRSTRRGDSHRWNYAIEMLHALHWYWNGLQWQEGEVAGPELVIDFMLSTAVEIKGETML